ncbi:MAG: glycosyltransferase family 4 protein, partial [Nitrospirae bacterium]|nr:glycosyltransferase family 4 protein [Nitrospirota bacterium]
KYKIPYILSAHGSVLRLMGKEFLKGLFDVCIGFKILNSAGKVAAVSNIEVEQYMSMGVSKDKITLIPNGINLSEFENAAELKGNFRGAYKLSGKKILLFIGRLNAIKGIDFLLKTFALISKDDKDTILVIAGPDDGYKSEIERLIRHLDINDRVLLIDGLYGEDKIAAMTDADLFVYPSKHEIFGIAPLEALMCGTPVIVTESCGCADFLREADAGIVVKYQDILQLSDAVKKILSKKDDAEDIAERGRELIQKQFNSNSISEKMIELYKSIYA